MVWAILAALGVPLWLCALGIAALVYRNRVLRRRPGDLPARVRLSGHGRWSRGHAVWVSDVLAWHGSPAAWRDDLFHVTAASVRRADQSEIRTLRRLGDAPMVADLTTADGRTVLIAASQDRSEALMGPFAGTRAPVLPSRATERHDDQATS